MKKSVFFSLIVSFLLFSYNISKKPIQQDNTCGSKFYYDTIVKKEVYFFVDEMPTYIDGERGIWMYIAKNATFPEQDVIRTYCKVQFVIDVEGKLIGARIKDKSNSEWTNAEKEIIKLFTSMPKWTSGKCAGKELPVLMSLPFHIDLNNR